MRFNERGQAFDVFKLLIAAVVAVAILALLLAILPLVRPPGQEPLRAAQELIRDISLKPSTPNQTQKVTFTPNYTINRRSISEASNGLVDELGVCVVPGDFDEESDVWDNSGNGIRVTYRGTSAKQVIIHGICDICSKLLDTDYFGEDGDYDPQIMSEWVGDNCTSDAFDPGNTTDICCVFALLK